MIRRVDMVSVMAAAVPQWAHRDARRACEHRAAESGAFWRAFHRQQRAFDYLCEACAAGVGSDSPGRLLPVSPDLVERLERDGVWEGVIGFPGAIDDPLQFSLLRDPIGVRFEEVRAVAPVADGPGERWIVGCEDWLFELDSEIGSSRQVAPLPADLQMAPNADLAVATDRAGHFVALAPAYGRHGAVIETSTGRVTMRLDRGDYQLRVCRFPLAFADMADRTVLVYATEWNRLDCSDPSTGTCLTDRDTPQHRETGDTDAHYLDYFFCGLRTSPGGRWRPGTSRPGRAASVGI
jgi:hypothetical protein